MEVGLKIITSDMARDMILSDAKARKEDEVWSLVVS